jgi:multidrug efflux pump subunit AcrB
MECALVPLSQVAKIKLQQGESTISRDMNRRYLLVKFDSACRSPAGAAGVHARLRRAMPSHDGAGKCFDSDRKPHVAVFLSARG